jgi:hypothetical protein
LFTLNDWWEHDGFVNEAKAASWQDLVSALASDEAFLGLSQGDWAVRKAFFPAAYNFYLRVYVPAEYDNDYPEQRGDFDVTCSPELAAELAELAAFASRLAVANLSAKDFFARRYGN